MGRVKIHPVLRPHRQQKITAYFYQMKSLFKSYTSFTRTERMGIIALLLLVFLLIVVRATMQFWVKSPVVDLSNVEIPVKKEQREPPKVNMITVIPPVKIDLNTVDSLTLVSLPGIGKGISHRILQRRRELGKFSSIEQVWEVYHFKQETKDMLLNYTKIK